MKNFLKILWLDFNVRMLEKTRKKVLLHILYNYRKEVNCIDSVESIIPNYFIEIDGKIKAKKRLTSILKKTF